ncbi:MAG: hypothetical protein LRY40_08160 [Shewanella fodinae]|nr:hypothetical protein [Shewanella fodinae]
MVEKVKQSIKRLKIDYDNPIFELKKPKLMGADKFRSVGVKESKNLLLSHDDRILSCGH